MRKYIISFGLAAVFMTAGCNKMLELDPKDSLTTERSLSTIEGIKAATAGMYKFQKCKLLRTIYVSLRRP